MKTPKERRKEQSSADLDEGDAMIIEWLKDFGFHQKNICALFNVNQGRVSDIRKRFPKARAYQAEEMRKRLP